MRGWMLRFSAGLSLLLLAIVLLFGVRSASTRSALTILRESAEGTVHVRTVWGLELADKLRFSRETLVEPGLSQEQIDILRQDIAIRPSLEWNTSAAADDPSGDVADWHRWDGFALTRETWPAGDWKVSVAIPYRFLEFGAGLLPAWVVLRSIRRRRRQRRGPPCRPGGFFALASILSAMLCLLVSSAWVQSEIQGAVVRRVEDTPVGSLPLYSVASWVSMPGWCHLQWAHGAQHWQGLQYPRGADNPDGDVVSWCAPEADSFSPESWSFSGFATKKWAGLHDAGIGWSLQGSAWAVELVAPYWLLWLVTACLPIFWLAVRRGWILRRPPGVCGRCGYDLRASTGRCPECGEAIRTDDPPRGAGVSPVHGAP